VKNTLSKSLAVATLIGVGAAAAFAGVSLRGQAGSPVRAPRLLATPDTLQETGLAQLDPMSFTPQYPLWSDGATKRRWLYLPPGTSIDASNPDAWQFPVGTRVWKEFSFGGRRVETRFMDRRDDGWHYATYIWNEDQTAATLAPVNGAASIQLRAASADTPAVNHRIPSEAECRACHAIGPTPVLAFSALQLSADRDPNAPHAEALRSGDVLLPALVERGLVRDLPESVGTSPRIEGSPLERSSLGYLHGNCGGCHRSDGALRTVGMFLAHSVVNPGDAKRTTIGVPARFMAPNARITPRAYEDSVIWRRMSARTPSAQMPPTGTQVVDSQATALIADWISSLGSTEARTELPRETNH
jgi:hypothetical protein